MECCARNGVLRLATVYQSDGICTNQFRHETYSLIGSLVVLSGMACLIKGVGQMS